MRISKIDNLTEEELTEIVKSSYSLAEVMKKIGYKANSGDANILINKRLEKYNISKEHFKSVISIFREDEDIFIENSPVSQSVLRRRYKKNNYSEYECAICGQGHMWNGLELTFTLDHINGNNKDNRLENLRWVCPNCDRQLDTFAGKNFKK